MTSLLETAEAFFEEYGWTTKRSHLPSELWTDYKGKHGHWPCIARTIEAKQQLIFYSMCPFIIPEQRSDAVMKFLTIVNYDLIMGNFEQDLSRGEVRFKTSLRLNGTPLSTELIEPLVYINALTMDYYLAGIRAVAEGASPESVLTLIAGPAADADDFLLGTS